METQKKVRIAYVIGTRPEIIRSAGIIQALSADVSVDLYLIHTGQHYDHAMSDVFFTSLGVPRPNENLAVGSGAHGAQTGEMMQKLESSFMAFKPDIVAVFGDTNSSLAAALSAAKLHIPIAHLESGCREWDMRLPEEQNRRVIDHLCNVAFAFSPDAVHHLKEEHVLADIYNTGDPLYEVFEKNVKKSVTSNILDRLHLEKGTYIATTIHRAGNVDDLDRFAHILEGMAAASQCPIIFPIHPHSRKQLELIPLSDGARKAFRFIDPIDYLDLLQLISNAEMVVTDSGGLQKEVFWAHVPCITLRTITAWSETVTLGVNFLVDADQKRIHDAITHIRTHRSDIDRHFMTMENPYYQPDTIGTMVTLLKKYAGRRWNENPSYES